MSVRNIGASVRDRLFNKARAEKQDYNLLLTRHALERMLYRLSICTRRLMDAKGDVPSPIIEAKVANILTAHSYARVIQPPTCCETTTP